MTALLPFEVAVFGLAGVVAAGIFLAGLVLLAIAITVWIGRG